MKIVLEGWESKGLRCPDVKVSLVVGGQVPRVTLIQMPNGTGKTTTLLLLNAALSGEAEKWTQKKVRDMRFQGDDIQKGQFLVKLRIDDHPLTFELNLDFESGSATYKTSSPVLGGIKSGHRYPPDWFKFFQPEFVRLFVFDGELAGKLLETEDNAAQKAIDALCQLYLLDRVGDRAQSEWEEATKAGGPKAPQGLARYKNSQNQLRAKKRKLEKSLHEAKTELKLIEKQIGERAQEVEKHRASVEEKQAHREALTLKKTKAKQKQSNAAIEVLSLLRRPNTIHKNWGKALVMLKDNLDRLHLPESTSKQFFDELVQEVNCICGREMDEAAKAHIKEHAANYLGEEISGQLNSLKTAIQTYVLNPEAKKPDDLKTAANELSNATLESETIDAEEKSLLHEIDAEAPASVLEKIAELDQLKQEQSVLLDLVEELTRTASDDDGDDTSCLDAIEKQLKNVDKKVAAITETVELRDKTELVKSITTQAKEEARKQISQVMRDDSNIKLQEILWRNPITIEDIGKSIKLKGQGGASTGQSLSVGYVFWVTLLGRGHHKLPLIVDSPANPLDNTVRREIAPLIPKLCEQFIAFTISPERESFVEPLHKAAKEDVLYLTLFRPNKNTKDLEAGLPKGGVTKTDGGILVNDREFFNSFDSKDEV